MRKEELKYGRKWKEIDAGRGSGDMAIWKDEWREFQRELWR